MKLSTTTIDNITEVLTRIVEFTDRRRDVLTRNLFDYQTTGFQPKDLPVCEFAECMTEAVSEHLRSKRLLLCDRENVSFGEAGSFDVDPVIDSNAMNLLKTSTKDYLQMQIHKLSENLMNNRIAVELLKQKQQRSSF
jgi:flagellar basal body rod protein FlgB